MIIMSSSFCQILVAITPSGQIALVSDGKTRETVPATLASWTSAVPSLVERAKNVLQDVIRTCYRTCCETIRKRAILARNVFGKCCGMCVGRQHDKVSY